MPDLKALEEMGCWWTYQILEWLQYKGTSVDQKNECIGLEFRLEIKSGGMDVGNMRPVYFPLGLLMTISPNLVKQDLVHTGITPKMM